MIFENSKNDWLAKELKRENFEGCVEHNFDHVLNRNSEISYSKTEHSDWKELNRYEKRLKSPNSNSHNQDKKSAEIFKWLIIVSFAMPILLPFVLIAAVIYKNKRR